MSAMLFKTSEHTFCFKPCSVAIAFAKAPFVMAFLAPAFIDFIGGNIARQREGEKDAED